ncbi:Por secretion system C-terminal sorting domain-containing protein [Chitinophaga sp. YR627]|uniref:T9SS type A sorting domain-containing protein n=1 Tax=Chitinophaga sp. YR627 TaxID=1881041 RepID=UPI0008EF8A8B|nr:T9SS type A sorting domain-containing protein [Chitinophaga sp. YR627]SFM81556.1 Por secretion system C-terminal sorting domain-containing protein [Chitinophaga sp. YR627]
MLKFTWTSVLSLFTAFTAFAQTNIAPQATAGTSYVSSWETITALNDNYTPANSNDKSHGAYGNWNNPNSIQWVQYDWSQAFSVTSVQVYWFDDAGGVLTPTTAYLESWNGTAWVNLGNIPLQKDAFNTLNFTATTTSRLRVSMRNTSQSTGLLEWRVTGTPVSTGGNGSAYTWPVYSPTISYDFRSEYPNLPTPSQILNDCPQVVGTQSSDWWTFRWGPKKKSVVTAAAITPMLARLNKDFRYFRDTMGWPADIRARNGYKSAVYLYGSGLCTDNADSTALGGWQSAIYYNGQNWPMILASYYPVYAFDPAYTGTDAAYQQSAMTHEGIHAMLADLPGVKNSAWFHEGGNVWFQQTADAKRSNNFSSLGFLNGTDFIAPFMPIECYSGWLQDGSFGGPAAEGVNMFNGSQQICTWKTYLGGHQYSSSFPTFLGNTLGDNAVPWIWRYASSRVLEGIASGIGEAQTRRLITEYRAKQALVDFGKWKSACVALLNNVFGNSIGAEWQPSWLNPAPWIATPYAKTTNNNGTLTPDTTTLPGWSGANQIPLTVTGSTVTVNFQPIGANMTCQLVYWTTSGQPVYSQYVSSGNVTLNLTTPAANNVVIAVITNTNYLYQGETTRKTKYDYRLQLVSGISGAASVNTKWYSAALLSTARTSEAINTAAIQTGIDWSTYCSQPFTGQPRQEEYKVITTQPQFQLFPNPAATSESVQVRFKNPKGERSLVTIYTLSGKVVLQRISTTEQLTVDGKSLHPGIYLVKIANSAVNATQKLIVN